MRRRITCKAACSTTAGIGILGLIATRLFPETASFTARLAGDSIRLGTWMRGPSTITVAITVISTAISTVGDQGRTIAPVGPEVISTEDMDLAAVGALEGEGLVPFTAEASPVAAFMAVGSAEAAPTAAEGDADQLNR